MVLILQFHCTVLCLELMFYIRCWEWEPHKIYVLNNIMQCNVILWQISVTDVFKSIGNISHLFLTLAFSLSVYDSCLFFKSISFFFFFFKASSVLTFPIQCFSLLRCLTLSVLFIPSTVFTCIHIHLVFQDLTDVFAINDSIHPDTQTLSKWW